MLPNLEEAIAESEAEQGMGGGSDGIPDEQDNGSKQHNGYGFGRTFGLLFISLHASMPCLQNTPVGGNLYRSKGANLNDTHQSLERSGYCFGLTFCQLFILLNASMPCLRNTPVGELIQKQRSKLE